MSETTRILAALKRTLRARGLTYRDVAERLGLSEATIKRIFSSGRIGLERLEQIAAVAGTGVAELARAAASSAPEPTELSLEQEEALAADPPLLAYFYLLLNGWRPGEIAGRYELGRHRHRRLLLALERLGLVAQGKGEEPRLRTSRSIAWRRHGPVRRLYETQVKALFLDGAFAGAGERLDFVTAELSDASIQQLGRRLARLRTEFEELAELDLELPHRHRRGVGLMLAFRPWTYWPLLKGRL